MSFGMPPKSVTLNDLERRMAVISNFYTEFGSFAANYVKVVEDSPYRL